MLPAAPLVDVPLGAPAATMFTAFMMALAWYDMRERRLPNGLTYPLLFLGLGWTAYAAPERLAPHALAAAGGLLALYALGLAFERTRGHQGLGFGDVKLVAAIGAWLGPLAIAPTLLLASLAAILWAPWHARRTGQPVKALRIPFGTFLALAAIMIAFFP